MNGEKVSLFQSMSSVPCQCTDVTWCKQLARISGESRFSSNLNADSTVHDAEAYTLFVYIMMSIHARMTIVCMSSFELHTFASGCTRQYSVPVFHTGWSDCTFWQLHPKSPPSAPTWQYSVPVFHTGWSDCTFWQLHPKSPPSAPGLCLTGGHQICLTVISEVFI
jgi:hypothetical protein